MLTIALRYKWGVNNKPMTIGFAPPGNKHIYSDTFSRCKNIRKRDLKNIVNILQGAKYVVSSKRYKERKDGIEAFHYFETTIRGKRIFLQVGEEQYKNGRAKRRYLYSISDNLNLKEEYLYTY